jgi:hypothetical protein
MKHLTIEWRHLDTKGDTCLRCSQTGKTLNQVIAELQKELITYNVKITFKETKLSKNQINQSNMILINDVPLEQILSGASVSKNYCQSCSCLTATDAYCRTIEYKGKQYEEIPEAIIRKAILQAAGINTEGEK